MEITEVRVYPVDEDKLKAYVTITFDQCFVVRDLKIIHGTNGLFVAMPSRKCKDGSFKDTAHPLNSETRRMIEDRILGRYQEILHQRQEPRQTTPPAEGEGSGDGSGDGAPPPGFTDPF
ncbi:MAG: septation regulator SpoVG [Nitrospinota bacterium]|nr:septation regulator SpoVG [Nitrospinota bacterium]MDP6617928.1 septation regulator SpoVG [Nitrospinota bacterium]